MVTAVRRAWGSDASGLSQLAASGCFDRAYSPDLDHDAHKGLCRVDAGHWMGGRPIDASVVVGRSQVASRTMAPSDDFCQAPFDAPRPTSS